MTRRQAPPRPARRGGGPRLVVRFVLRFSLGWLAALVLLSLVPAIERGAVSATMACLALLGRLAGAHPELHADLVQIGHAPPLQIVPDCTPVLPTGVLWAAMIAYPARVGWRLGGMVLAAAALWLYNLMRVLLLIAILRWSPVAVSFIHVYVWQTLTIVLIAALFVLWIRRGPVPAAP